MAEILDYPLNDKCSDPDCYRCNCLDCQGRGFVECADPDSNSRVLDWVPCETCSGVGSQEAIINIEAALDAYYGDNEGFNWRDAHGGKSGHFQNRMRAALAASRVPNAS